MTEPNELKAQAKELRIYDRDGRVVTQGSFNAIMAQIDQNNRMREALKVIGCRAIPAGNSKNCNCVVHEALRRQAWERDSLAGD